MSTTVSNEEYLALHAEREELRRLKYERARERAEWDELYTHRGDNAYFVIRTRDGHLCFVPMGGKGRAVRGTGGAGPRELMCQLLTKHEGPREIGASMSTLPAREVRRYIETRERIMGVPVFEEVAE